MPELPEVETIRKTLKQLIIGKTIEEMDVYWSRIVKHPDDIEHFKHMLVGQSFSNIERKGKFLIFQLDDYTLVSHLRMEGKYSLHDKKDPVDKHTHIIFKFTDDQELRYTDVRKFGTMHVFPKGEHLQAKPLNLLAPDPFEPAFTFDYFQNKLRKTSRVIKTVLLDQTVIAGLGNIYVDETLFKAKVHPLCKANELSDGDIRRIMRCAEETLLEAIEQGGTTIRSYVASDGEMGMFQQKLYVYGQEDEPCQVCSKPIIKIKVSNRGTHLCPSCQKERAS